MIITPKSDPQKAWNHAQTCLGLVVQASAVVGRRLSPAERIMSMTMLSASLMSGIVTLIERMRGKNAAETDNALDEVLTNWTKQVNIEIKSVAPQAPDVSHVLVVVQRSRKEAQG